MLVLLALVLLALRILKRCGVLGSLLLKDPALLAPEARQYASYPGGHNEGFPDTFKQLYTAIYRYIQAGDYTAPTDFPTFVDGHYELVLGEAILRSARESRWVTVEGESA